MRNEDGQTKGTTRRRKNSEHKDGSKRLGEHGLTGSIHETESLGASQANSPRENPARTGSEQGNISLGKVLRRLDLIEEKYLAYVHGHQERLETRLNQSRDDETDFKNSVASLRQEIYDLVTENPLLEDADGTE